MYEQATYSYPMQQPPQDLLAKVRSKAMYLTTKHVEAVSTSLEQVTQQAMSQLDHLPRLGVGLGAVDAYKKLMKQLSGKIYKCQEDLTVYVQASDVLLAALRTASTIATAASVTPSDDDHE